MEPSIDLTGEPEDFLPPKILEDWLPIKNKCVFHLFEFDRYPVSRIHYLTPPDLGPVLHKEEILNFDYGTLLQLGLPEDSSTLEKYQAVIGSTQDTISSVTLRPHPGLGKPITLPVWIFDYWREMELAIGYWEEWRTALVWLRSQSESPTTSGRCQELLMALSFFPWSGNNASVKHITSLLSQSDPESYLRSFHIDHIIGSISMQYQESHKLEVPGRHIFMTVDALASILKFYGGPRASVKTGSTLWERLMRIENQIIKGEVDSVCGVHHLPLHWVSIVIDIQQGCIFYGDSLKKPMPKLERNAFTQWVKHLLRRSKRKADSLPVRSLATGYQDDVTSCGLFALNAIRHHYLGHSLLFPDQVSVALMRMEIALDLVHGNTV